MCAYSKGFSVDCALDFLAVLVAVVLMVGGSPCLLGPDDCADGDNLGVISCGEQEEGQTLRGTEAGCNCEH